jgi:predicted metal-dependent hydrolase
LAEALTIGDPAIEVRLRRNARARRMILRIARPGPVPVLTLPPGVPVAKARAFLSDQEGWLRRHVAACAPRLPVVEGARLPVRDGTLTVRASRERSVRACDGLLLVPGGAEDMPVRVGAWLREAARRDCVERAARHSAALGLPHGRVTMRDTRSRWGSCTGAGDLMFSWRLIMAPSAVLDYVVAHEVAHLAEMNHSDRFWAQVARLFPDHEAPRAWLRRNGSGLHAWDFSRAAGG